MLFDGLVKRSNQIWIVFGLFQVFLGHQYYFWKFQKVSKFLTQNSVKKMQVTSVEHGQELGVLEQSKWVLGLDSGYLSGVGQVNIPSCSTY